MQRQTFVSTWAERVMEACWLLALVMMPIYFNLLSARHFEPDKAVVLRGLMLVLLAAWSIKVLERGQLFNEWPSLRAWVKLPMIIPMLVYAAIFVFSTIVSIMPDTSLWGGYNRLQGTYTNLSYLVLFAAVLTNLRTREQFDRLVTVAILTTLPVAGYGIIQHNGVDPLPWKGDVVTRVASTMGNSIFVSAYLIMVLPLVYYRMVQLSSVVARTSESDGETPAWVDLAWGGALLVLALGQLALLYGVMKLGSLLYTVQLTTWWLYPFTIIAIGFSYMLFSTRLTQLSRNSIWPYLPGVALILIALIMAAQGMLSAPLCDSTGQSGALCLQRSQAPNDYRDQASDFKTWLLIGYGCFLLFYIALAALPRRASARPSRLLAGLGLAGLVAVAVALVATIIFSQSRGPWMGGIAGTIVFFTLVLIQGMRTTQRPELRRLFTGMLAIWLFLGISLTAFIAVLNLVPGSFASLRTNRYIARVSNLLETEDGTGKVRILIWRGDGITQGAVGLITADPLRTLVGYGPESMFVAYNPFYPPDLAHLESRGASPDRSHQTLLDELVHKGALGLFSHFLVFLGFVMLMLRLLNIPRWINLLAMVIFILGMTFFFFNFLASPVLGIIALVSGLAAVALSSWMGYDRPLAKPAPFMWQIFFIACLASILGHFVETFFGIPIVSTLTYNWLIIGGGVAAARLAGLYMTEPAAAEVVEPIEQVESDAPKQTTPAAKPKQGAQQPRGTRRERVAAQNRARPGRAASSRRTQPIRWIYSVPILMALLGAWFFNLRVTYADMRFNQGQQWSNAGAFDRELIAYAAYDDAIDNAPGQDFYYLYFGRTLLAIAQLAGPEQQKLLEKGLKVDHSIPENASLEQLPEADYSELLSGGKINQSSFDPLAREFLQQGAYRLLNYSRLAMEEARNLNPTNKDHYANLGRIYSTWYRSLKINGTNDTQKLQAAIDNYSKAHEVAPQDVALTGQWGSLVAIQDPARAQTILEEAVKLDPIYPENLVRLGEIYRQQGKLEAAAEQYGNALSYDPNVMRRMADLDANLEQAVRETMQLTPSLLAKLSAGYSRFLDRCNERATPAEQRSCRIQRLDAQVSYTQFLSNTKQYQSALAEAEEGRTFVQDQLPQATTQREKDSLGKFQTTFDQLIQYLLPLAPQGGVR